MIQKIKRTLQENIKHHKRNNILLRELDWANVYHDSIRGKQWLENLPLNIGRWAGSYSFFYVLNRILGDYKPKKILELGLGESSKFISTYLDNYLLNTTHLIIEQNDLWRKDFVNKFGLSTRTEIKVCDLTTKNINGYNVNSYKNFENTVLDKFDLYVIDGPFGSEGVSRYEIVNLMKRVEDNDEFIIVFDDYQRKGEQETIKELLKLFKSKNIKVYQNTYFGAKNVTVLVTEKYKYVNSI